MCGFPYVLIVEPTHIVCWPERKSSNLCVTSLFILHIHSPSYFILSSCAHCSVCLSSPSSVSSSAERCVYVLTTVTAHSLRDREDKSSLIWPTLCSHSIDGASCQWCCPTCCLVCSTACQLIIFHLASPPYAYPYDIPTDVITPT
jgi:hypothetical protein